MREIEIGGVDGDEGILNLENGDEARGLGGGVVGDCEGQQCGGEMDKGEVGNGDERKNRVLQRSNFSRLESEHGC